MRGYSIDYLKRNLRHIETFYESIGEQVVPFNQLEEIFNKIHTDYHQIKAGQDGSINVKEVEEVQKVCEILLDWNAKALDPFKSHNTILRIMLTSIYTACDDYLLASTNDKEETE